MRNLQFTGKMYGETITLKQVSKATARKLFDSGQSVYLQSSNFHPFGVWSNAIDINKSQDESTTFESRVNNFEYYNCANNETGKYATFYQSI